MRIVKYGMSNNFSKLVEISEEDMIKDTVFNRNLYVIEEDGIVKYRVCKGRKISSMSKDEYLIFKDMLGKLKDAIVKTNCDINLIIFRNCSYNEGLLPVLRMYSKGYSKFDSVNSIALADSEEGFIVEKEGSKEVFHEVGLLFKEFIEKLQKFSNVFKEVIFNFNEDYLLFNSITSDGLFVYSKKVDNLCCGMDLGVFLNKIESSIKEYFSRICLVDFYNCKSSEDEINKQKVKDGSISFADLHSEGRIPTKEWFYENYNSIKCFIEAAKGLTEVEKRHAQMLICDSIEYVRPQAITDFIEEIEDFWRNWVSEQYNKYTTKEDI